METNLFKALNCEKTHTEFAVLAIYAEAISYSYMWSIRAGVHKGENALDLGPFHTRVHAHMKAISKNPDILIGEDVSFETAALKLDVDDAHDKDYEDDWQNPAVVKKVLTLLARDY